MQVFDSVRNRGVLAEETCYGGRRPLGEQEGTTGSRAQELPRDDCSSSVRITYWHVSIHKRQLRLASVLRTGRVPSKAPAAAVWLVKIDTAISEEAAAIPTKESLRTRSPMTTDAMSSASS